MPVVLLDAGYDWWILTAVGGSRMALRPSSISAPGKRHVKEMAWCEAGPPQFPKFRPGKSKLRYPRLHSSSSPPRLRHPQVAEGQAVEFRAVHFQRLLNFHRGWVFHDGGLGSGSEGCGAVRVVEGPVVIGVLPCRIVPAHALHRRRRNPAVVCTSDVVDPVEKDRCAGPSCRLSINSRRRRAAPDVRLTAVRGMRDRPGRTG